MPSNQTNVGVLDTSTNAFSTVAATSFGTSYGGFMGGAVVGTKIFFTPFSTANVVGVLDTVTNVFSTVAVSIGAAIGGCCSTSFMYNGAVAVGNKVYFAPYNHNATGVFDAVTYDFSTVSTTGIADGAALHKYGGAVAVGSRVLFVPGAQHNVGSLQTFVTSWDQVVAMYEGGSTIIEIHADLKVSSTLTVTRDVTFVGKCTSGPCNLNRSDTGRHFLFGNCVTNNCTVSFTSLHFADGSSSSTGG